MRESLIETLEEKQRNENNPKNPQNHPRASWGNRGFHCATSNSGSTGHINNNFGECTVNIPPLSPQYVRPRITTSELEDIIAAIDFYIELPDSGLSQDSKFKLWELQTKLEKVRAGAGEGSGNRVVTAAQIDSLLEDSETAGQGEQKTQKRSEDSLLIESILSKALTSPQDITPEEREQYFTLTGNHL